MWIWNARIVTWLTRAHCLVFGHEMTESPYKIGLAWCCKCGKKWQNKEIEPLVGEFFD